MSFSHRGKTHKSLASQITLRCQAERKTVEQRTSVETKKSPTPKALSFSFRAFPLLSFCRSAPVFPFLSSPFLFSACLQCYWCSLSFLFCNLSLLCFPFLFFSLPLPPCQSILSDLLGTFAFRSLPLLSILLSFLPFRSSRVLSSAFCTIAVRSSRVLSVPFLVFLFLVHCGVQYLCLSPPWSAKTD